VYVKKRGELVEEKTLESVVMIAFLLVLETFVRKGGGEFSAD
jgi:hypothetical protein